MVSFGYFSVLNLFAMVLQLLMSSLLGLLITLLIVGAYLYFGVAYRPVPMPPPETMPERVIPDSAPALPAPVLPAPVAPEREGRVPMPPQPAGIV